MRIRLGSKGISLSALSAITFTMIMIGLFVVIGIYVNEQIGTQIGGTVSVLNESVAFTADNTFYALAQKYVRSVSAVYCNTTQNGLHVGVNGTIPSANSTHTFWVFQSPNLIKIGANASSGAPCGDFAAGVTHYVDYNAYGYNYMTTANATSGMSVLVQWLPIIAVVLATAIIIAVLFGWFRSERGL